MQNEEKTMSLAEDAFRFVVGSFRPLLVVGSVTLVLAIGVIGLMSLKTVARFNRNAGIQSRMLNILAEKERQLSAYSATYAAFRDEDDGKSSIAASARENARVLTAKIGEIRRGLDKYIALPCVYENEIAHADEVLYQDAAAGVCIRVDSSYTRDETAGGRRKRLVLAGWVIVNALFAVFLAIRKKERKQDSRT